MAEAKAVSVMVPVAVAGPYTYAAPPDLDHGGEPGRCLARGLEALVRVVDVGLFVSEIGVLLGHTGSRNAIGRDPTHDPAVA